MGEPCDTGISWPVIDSIQGRVRSVIDSATGERKLLTLFTADFLSMREIQDFRLVKFDDGAIFLAQTRDALSHDQEERIRSSLKQDVFREDLNIRILTQRQNLRAPRWKVREIYIVSRSTHPHWAISDVEDLLETADFE